MKKSIFLIEWRMKKTHWSEIGQGIWEPDHNGEIWFTKKGAKAKMIERLNDIRNTYEMRIAEYVPRKSPNKSLDLTPKIKS